MNIRVLLLVVLCSLGLLTLSSCGKGEKKEASKENEIPLFCNLEDMIINPAGTNAQRVMLVSVALQAKNAEEVKKLEERSPLIKDLIVTSLSSRTVESLTKAGYKDSLKIELKSKLKSRLRNIEIKNIYFTKFIIQ